LTQKETDRNVCHDIQLLTAIAVTLTATEPVIAHPLDPATFFPINIPNGSRLALELTFSDGSIKDATPPTQPLTILTVDRPDLAFIDYSTGCATQLLRPHIRPGV
jgi:hypothetical protein